MFILREPQHPVPTHGHDDGMDTLQFVLDRLGYGLLLAHVRVSVCKDDGEIRGIFPVAAPEVEDLFPRDFKRTRDVRPPAAILDALDRLQRAGSKVKRK